MFYWLVEAITTVQTLVAGRGGWGLAQTTSTPLPPPCHGWRGTPWALMWVAELVRSAEAWPTHHSNSSAGGREGRRERLVRQCIQTKGKRRSSRLIPVSSTNIWSAGLNIKRLRTKFNCRLPHHTNLASFATGFLFITGQNRNYLLEFVH